MLFRRDILQDIADQPCMVSRVLAPQVDADVWAQPGELKLVATTARVTITVGLSMVVLAHSR
jgi:hypothetical protein